MMLVNFHILASNAKNNSLLIQITMITHLKAPNKGHFTHTTESPWPLHFRHSHWWERRSQSKFASHYARGTKWSMWMQDGCKAYMDSYMASNGSCFMVTWNIFNLEVGDQTQKLGDHGTPNGHNCLIILFYHVWGPTWIEIHWNNIWLTVRSHMTYTTLEGPWPHYIILKVSWESLWTLSFGPSQFLGHGSWLMCGVALSVMPQFWEKVTDWGEQTDQTSKKKVKKILPRAQIYI